MQARKWLALGAVLSVGVGCEGYFATDTVRANCRTTGCPPGEACKWAATEGPRCEKEAVDEALICLEDTECQSGHICMATPDTPGQCREGCRVGQSPCFGKDRCIGFGGDNTHGALGRCEGVPNCHVGDGSCGPGEVCGLSGDRLGVPGICRAEATGAPCEDDRDCSFASTCALRGDTLQCTPGERCAGHVVATLKSFRLLQPQNPEAIAPLCTDDAEANPHAGWLDGSEAALVHMVVQGPGANREVELRRGLASVECLLDACEAESCVWTCALPLPWTGTEAEFVLTLGCGPARSHKWTYAIGPPADN